jgi:Trk-type K+ transport system membrane component
VFLRTPKEEDGHRLLSALWSARTETFWAVMLWTLAALAAFRGQATLFVLVLFAWQGSVYASALFMSWLNQHMVLSAQLERRRRTEWLRERSTIITTASVGALGGAAIAGIVAFIIGLGGSNPGNPPNPFNVQEAATENPSPATDDGGISTTTEPIQSSTTTTTVPESAPSTTTPDTEPTEPPTTVPPTEPPTTAPPVT